MERKLNDDCARWREMILRHDSLDEEAARSLADHLRACPRCGGDLHALEEMGDIFKGETISKEIDFADAIMARIEREQRNDSRLPSIVAQTLVALIALEVAFLLGVKVKIEESGVVGGLLDAFGVAELGYPVYNSVSSFLDGALWLFGPSAPYTVSVNFPFLATVGTIIAIAYSALLYFELKVSHRNTH